MGAANDQRRERQWHFTTLRQEKKVPSPGSVVYIAADGGGREGPEEQPGQG